MGEREFMPDNVRKLKSMVDAALCIADLKEHNMPLVQGDPVCLACGSGSED